MKRRNHPKRSEAELINLYHLAPDSARLDTETIAAGLHVRASTLRWYRSRSGGPPFIKRGRSVLYLKADAAAWHDSKSKRIDSTSELTGGTD